MFSSIPDPYPLGASMTIKMCSDSATCLPEGRIATGPQGQTLHVQFSHMGTLIAT